jgi:hypothetical protein
MLMRHQIELKQIITTLTAAFAAAQVVIFANPTLAEMPRVQTKTEQSNKELAQKVDFIAPEELKTRIANNTRSPLWMFAAPPFTLRAIKRYRVQYIQRFVA